MGFHSCHGCSQVRFGPAQLNPLDDLNADELVTLTDVEYQGKVRKHARKRTAEAMNTIEDVMVNSDDDQARLIAATKMLKIAKAEDEERQLLLPVGVSEEVMKIALAGFGKLANLARDTVQTSILRDVTPAKSDPRPSLPDLSPLDIPVVKEDFGYETLEENVPGEENDED